MVHYSGLSELPAYPRMPSNPLSFFFFFFFFALRTFIIIIFLIKIQLYPFPLQLSFITSHTAHF